MSGFDDFYHSHYYPVTTAANRDDEPQQSHDAHGNPMLAPSMMGYSQPGAYDMGQYQNIYHHSQPDLFGSGVLSTSHANEHHAGYPMRGSNLEGRLSSVNISYDPWSSTGTQIPMGQQAGGAFPHNFSNTYSMSASLTSQQIGLSPHPNYSTFPTQPQVQSPYWGMDNHQNHAQQNQATAPGRLQDSQLYPQSYASSSHRSLQPRAIQPKGPSPYSGRFPSHIKPEPRTESSPYANIYSASGFDIMGALFRVISRPDPKINIGAVDLSCAFVLCDITQDDQPIVYMSEAFGRLTGYSEEEIIGRNCRFLQSPDGNVQPGMERKFVDSDAVYQLKTTIEHRDELQVSVINYRKGGQPFMNLVTMIPIRWASEDYRFYVGFQVDLVEKPDAVTKKNPNGTYMINYQRNQLPNYVVPPPDLYQTRPDLAVQFGHDQVSAILRSISASKPECRHYLDRILVENMDDVIHVLSFDGVFLYLSPSCRKVLEYDSAELANKTLSTICHPSDIGPVTRDLRSSITTAPVSVVYRIRKKHSGYTWFESHGSWHVEQGRGRTFLVLVGRDRPVYSLGQVAGLGSECLAENDLWMKLSTSGIILYIPAKSRPVLGRTPEDLIGTGVQDLLGAEDRSEAQQALQTSRGGRQAAFNHQIRHKKGHTMQVQTTLFPGDTKEGVRPSFLVAQVRFPKSSQPATDITEDLISTDLAASLSGGREQITDSITAERPPFHDISNLADSTQLPSEKQQSPPKEQLTVFPELAPTRGSSWQFELRELEKRNRALADELQRLLTRKKKRKRKQTAIPVGKSCAMCQTKYTPEWRRGPSGGRDLCNSCGLRWAKQVRSATQSEKSV